MHEPGSSERCDSEVVEEVAEFDRRVDHGMCVAAELGRRPDGSILSREQEVADGETASSRRNCAVNRAFEPVVGCHLPPYRKIHGITHDESVNQSVSQSPNYLMFETIIAGIIVNVSWVNDLLV